MLSRLNRFTSRATEASRESSWTIFRLLVAAMFMTHGYAKLLGDSPAVLGRRHRTGRWRAHSDWPVDSSRCPAGPRDHDFCLRHRASGVVSDFKRRGARRDVLGELSDSVYLRRRTLQRRYLAGDTPAGKAAQENGRAVILNYSLN